MKAAILVELNSPLIVADVESPKLEAGQVLVRVGRSGICGKQIGEIAGNFGPDSHLPHLLGHEGAGIVADIGSGVTHVNVGDHVVLHWRRGNGLEAKCPKYKWDKGYAGGGPVTTFNEQAVVSENRLTKIDKDISFDVAALMGCAVTTGMGILYREAIVPCLEAVAVIGCGGVGLNVIQAARILGADNILAIDVHRTKLLLAEKMGATRLVDSRKHFTPPPIYDVAVDTTGIPSMIAMAYELTAAGGKAIMVGQTKARESVTFTNFLQHFKGKTLMDSQGGGTVPDIDIPAYLDLWKKGLLKLEEMITHRFPLADVNEAMDVVRRGEAGRVILET